MESLGVDEIEAPTEYFDLRQPPDADDAWFDEPHAAHEACGAGASALPRPLLEECVHDERADLGGDAPTDAVADDGGSALPPSLQSADAEAFNAGAPLRVNNYTASVTAAAVTRASATSRSNPGEGRIKTEVSTAKSAPLRVKANNNGGAAVAAAVEPSAPTSASNAAAGGSKAEPAFLTGAPKRVKASNGGTSREVPADVSAPSRSKATGAEPSRRELLEAWKASRIQNGAHKKQQKQGQSQHQEVQQQVHNKRRLPSEAPKRLPAPTHVHEAAEAASARELLEAHNARVGPAPQRRPNTGSRTVSVAAVRAWERTSGRKYANLDAEERLAINAELARR